MINPENGFVYSQKHRVEHSENQKMLWEKGENDDLRKDEEKTNRQSHSHSDCWDAESNYTLVDLYKTNSGKSWETPHHL